MLVHNTPSWLRSWLARLIQDQAGCNHNSYKGSAVGHHACEAYTRHIRLSVSLNNIFYTVNVKGHIEVD